ncbi:MAG: sigma-70 family RNA polymerase sigma factor [Bryobacteraceae bacterium]|nr:sigma-70 family RNA polymerase sigma factor [Bryobacteraceae bacterium]
MPQPANITQFLAQVREGKPDSERRLFDLVYQELHRLASGLMRRERRDHTLQASALVNEAYLRLVGHQDIDWESRSHFYMAAAQVMRRILIDHARKRQAGKRFTGIRRVDLHEAMTVAEENDGQMLDLDSALNRLAAIDPRQCQIVELRFFAGLTVDETARVLSVSEKTVKRDWAVARAWLEGELRGASAV